MKTPLKLLTACMAAAILFLAVPVMAEKDRDHGDSIFSEKGPGQRELTPERIERIMKRLAEKNPEKAKELEQLRQQDEQKFKDELRKIARKQFTQRGGRKGRGGRERGKDEYGQGKNGKPPRRDGPEHHDFRKGMKRRIQQHEQEYIEWLEQNNPEHAKGLAEIKEKDPGLYHRKLAIGMKKHRGIMLAEENDPKLAELLKNDLQLKKERNELLTLINATTDEQQKQQLTEKLKDVVSNRFDLLMEKRQLRYESMLKRLEKLKEQAQKHQTELEKLKDSRQQQIQKRLDAMLEQKEKFNWE